MHFDNLRSQKDFIAFNLDLQHRKGIIKLAINMRIEKEKIGIDWSKFKTIKDV